MHTISDPALYLQDYIETRIPLTAEMGIRVESWDDRGLILTAPFPPNRNDKGTAFGGSLSALVTLAGWGLTFLFLRDAGISADVMVRRTRIDYERPVRGDIATRCHMPEEQERNRFLEDVRRTGKARWTLIQEVAGNGLPAVTCEGLFVAVAAP
jgi:thioesterase domain-containing protein